MTKRNGLKVEVRDKSNGKLWTYVVTHPDGSPVAFQDWFEMIQGIIRCEVIKYGHDPDNAEDWERWGGMAKEFLARACEFGVTWEELRDEFGLPGSPRIILTTTKEKP